MSDLKQRLTASQVCDVQFINHMQDGTAIIGVLADFTYDDNSTSGAENSSLYLRYNESTHL